MLKYRIIQVLFIILIFSVVLLHKYYDFSLYSLFFLFLAYVGIIAYGSSVISSGFFLKTICSVDTNEKLISLTFDDGPDPVNTPALLDVLAKHKVKATFFVIGKHIAGNESVLQRIDNEGHVIGNHTFNHDLLLDFKSPAIIEKELSMTEVAVQKVISKKLNYFRPPYGVTNPMIAKALSGTNYAVIGWNIRSLDTVVKDNLKLEQRVKDKVKPGSIILFHDTRSNIAVVIDRLIIELQQQGYKFVALDELIKLKAYA